jgi:hypothetical protein
MSELARHLVELQRTRPLKRTLAGIVREELSTILAARAAGYGYEQICQALEPMGVQVTARQLRDVVYRVRRDHARTLDAQHPQPAGRTAASVAARTWAATDPSHSQTDARQPPPDRLQPPRSAQGAGPGFVRQILSSPSEIDDLARRFREARAASGGTQR